jgi:hypothetical protein
MSQREERRMRKRRREWWAAIVLVLALPVAAGAERAVQGVQVEPGLWEFRTSLPEALSAGAEAYRTCIRERTITPSLVMARQRECRIWNAVFAGPAAKWSMRCETPAGPLPGRGTLRSGGATVSGTLEFTMALGSLEIPMTGEFRGRRLGPCR